MIKLQIVGNLGKDCIQKEINGKSVINFSVAHTEKFKDAQGNQKEKTTWVECAYWTDRTAVAQYLKKGQLVFAEGAPEADAYLNKEGQAAATLRMRVANLQLLGSSRDNQPGAEQNTSNTFAQSAAQSNLSSINNSTNSSVPEDDLPF